jgi:predicted membrane protein
MKDIDCRKGPSGLKKAVFGLMLLTAGILLFAFNFGYLPPEHYHIVFSIPTLFIAIGALNLFERRSLPFGIIITTIGVLTILPKILDVHYDFSMVFWPIILMAIGVLILTKKFLHHPIKRVVSNNKKHHKRTGYTDDTCIYGDYEYKPNKGAGYIDFTNIFSGNEYKFIEPIFRGGNITNIFGGNELDLTRTQLAEGKNVLDVTCVFGGANIIVPSDWKVTIQVNSILGAFEDKRYFIDYDIEKQFDRELIITGSVIFGGGELKSR